MYVCVCVCVQSIFCGSLAYAKCRPPEQAVLAGVGVRSVAAGGQHDREGEVAAEGDDQVVEVVDGDLTTDHSGGNLRKNGTPGGRGGSSVTENVWRALLRSKGSDPERR